MRSLPRTIRAALLSLGTDLASLQNELHAVLDSRMDEILGEQLENSDDAARLVDIMVRFVPGAAAASFTRAALVAR